MKISTKGRYSVRLMLDLAVHKSDGNVSIRTISRRQEISEKYLEQIITVLVKAKFVTSVRGTNGGYALSRNAEEYTVGDILRATEGSLAPVACVENGECEKIGSCVTAGVWKEIYQAVNNVVDNITLQDLVNRYNNGLKNECSEVKE